MSDYISRAELDRIIHLLHTECAYDMPSFDSKNGYKVIPTRYHKGYQQSLIDLESRIAELPSADVRENIKGEWIKIQSGDKDFPEIIVCNKCYHENSHLDFNEHNEPIGKVFVKSNFCPNCGADMRGE